MKPFNPRSSWYLIRYALPVEETKGGILIPEEYRVRANEGEVLAVGPGRQIPLYKEERTVMSAGVGDRVLYIGHELQPCDEEVGLVADEAILGIVDEEHEDLLPANDWVTMSGFVREAETKGGLEVPERWRKRPKKGIIRALGPGSLRVRGPRQGTREACCVTMGLDESELLVGRTAWWDAGARMVEVTLPSGETLLMVRSGDLAAMEEEG